MGVLKAINGVAGAILLLGSLAFGQNKDSREGDSLAMVAILNANPDLKNKWDLQRNMEMWDRNVTLTNGRITTLAIAYDNISIIPKEIRDLTELVVLNLAGGRLKSLPEEIGTLSKLTYINLSYNGLTSLPESFCSLTKLTRMTLWSNNIEYLPENFGNLSQLQQINIGGIGVKRLPESFGKLVLLDTLLCSSHKMTTLPNTFTNLVKLKKLDLGSGNLVALPKDIGKLTNLTYLNLYKNDLTSIEPGLVENVNIKTCYLDYNRIPVNELSSEVLLWADQCNGSTYWRTTQKDPSPILPTTLTKTIPLTATIADNRLTLSAPVPAGSSVVLFDLSGRRIVSGELVGSSFAVPNLAKGIYVAEILTGGQSVVQKVVVR